MDQLQPWINAHFPSFWGPLVGMLVVCGYQWAKAKFPDFLGKLPHLVPSATPAAPVPVVPAAPSNHPALDALLKLVGGTRAATVLAGEVQRMVGEPEPAKPVEGSQPKELDPAVAAWFREKGIPVPS